MSRKYRTDVKALRKLMIDMDIFTVTDLADKSGVNRNTLSGILNEEIQPSSDVMFKLAEALEMMPNVAGAVFFATDLRNT